MTVENVTSKIKNAEKIIGIIRDGAIEFNELMPLREPLCPYDIANILEEYVYLLNHLEIANEVFRGCKV